MGKKDEYRFTIRFDPDDDRHQRAAQILNSQGRKIARYVARAVLAYNGENIEPAVAGPARSPGGRDIREFAERGRRKSV